MSEYGATAANRRAGKFLQTVRQELGRRTPEGNRYRPISQARLAKLLGDVLGTDVPLQSTISDWEGGVIAVPSAVLIAAAQLLGENDPVGKELLLELSRPWGSLAA